MKNRKTNVFPALAVTLFSAGTFLAVFSSWYNSPYHQFKRETGANYMGEVEEEYKDLKFHKFVVPTDNQYNTQKKLFYAYGGQYRRNLVHIYR